MRTLAGHSDSVFAVAATPDGKHAVSASDDDTLKVWDLESGREVRTLAGHSDSVFAVAVAPDGKRVVSASHDQTLKVWDLESGMLLTSFAAEGPVNCCAVAPCGTSVVAGDDAGQIHILRLEPGRPKVTTAPERQEPARGKSEMARTQVFVSYSHADVEWLQLLRTHLAPVERLFAVDVWDDRRIAAGTRWREEIEKAMDAAKVAVLLVSPHFLASRFINEVELPRLLGAAQKRGLTVVWVPVSASLVDLTALGAVQGAHDPAEPLDTLTHAEQNRALVDIARQILAAAQR